jgi:Lon protease-like protein
VAPTLLPLFPLGLVLYPGVMLPLHIFEERYRRLVRELLDMHDGERLFGVVAIKAGREVGADGITALHEIGCTAELRYAEAYRDGRFDIIATGVTRFRVLEVKATEPLRATVDLLPDVRSMKSRSLAVRVGRLFATYREALLAAQGVQEDARDTDSLELPADPVDLGYLIAAAMILDLSDKQLLLAAPTVDERLRLELALLRREESLVSGLSLRPAVELPRIPYASN